MGSTHAARREVVREGGAPVCSRPLWEMDVDDTEKHEEHECPVCLTSFVKDKMIRCRNGHSVCLRCSRRLVKPCPPGCERPHCIGLSTSCVICRATGDIKPIHVLALMRRCAFPKPSRFLFLTIALSSRWWTPWSARGRPRSRFDLRSPAHSSWVDGYRLFASDDQLDEWEARTNKAGHPGPRKSVLDTSEVNVTRGPTPLHSGGLPGHAVEGGPSRGDGV